MEITTAHAHITREQSDCDGPTYQEYTVFVSDEDKAKSAACDGVNDFWEIEFKDQILTSQVSMYALTHRLTLEASEDGFNWREQTDEGYRGGEVRWCHDEDCGESYSQRDIYAEMMGY